MTVEESAAAAGLDRAAVRARVEAGQVNTAPPAPGRTVAQILRANVLTRFNAILGVLFVVVMVVGPVQDALFGAVLVVNTGFGVVQELRAKRALDRLAILTAARAQVIREGVANEIPVDQVVLDDVLELRPGDQLPVDGVVLLADGLEADEALLTGEAEPVAKQPGERVLSGSFVVAGDRPGAGGRRGRTSLRGPVAGASAAVQPDPVRAPAGHQPGDSSSRPPPAPPVRAMLALERRELAESPSCGHLTPGTLASARRDARGQRGSPLAGPGRLLRLEPVLPGYQEALRLRGHIETVLAEQTGHTLGGPAGQRGRPVHPGIEGGRLDRVTAERAEPLTQPRAQRVRLDRQAAHWLAGGLDSRLARRCPAHGMRVRRPADDHQVSVGQNRRVSLGHRDNTDVEDRTEPGSDGLGNQVRVAVHGFIDNHSPHGCHLLIVLAFTSILPRPA